MNEPSGQLLRANREASGLTQSELAARTGLALASVRAYEQGRGRPSRQAVLQLAEAMRLKVGAINALLRSIGEDELPTGPLRHVLPEHLSYAAVKAEIARYPWATLVWDDSAVIVGWNGQATGLLNGTSRLPNQSSATSSL